jgi:hypothetical protein
MCGIVLAQGDFWNGGALCISHVGVFCPFCSYLRYRAWDRLVILHNGFSCRTNPGLLACLCICLSCLLKLVGKEPLWRALLILRHFTKPAA